MAAAPAAFGAPAGAIDREGAARRNWHGWKAPSRGFIVYPHRLHVFFLIIAGAPQVTIFVPFSGCLLYGDAKPIQANVGSDRGPVQGLFRWATVLVPSRVWLVDRQRRAPRARAARLRRVWPSLARQGPVNRFGPCKGSWRDGGKSGRGCFRVRRATHTPPAHHACARARDTGAATRTSWCSARMRAAAQQSRGRGGRCTRPRVTMGTRPRTTRTSRVLDAARGAAGGRQRLDRRHQEEEAEEEGEGRKVSATTARCSTTGLSPRGMRVRYIIR